MKKDIQGNDLYKKESNIKSGIFLEEELYEEKYIQGYKLILSNQEKVNCLREIIKKLKKIIYVYEKSLEINSNYNYKIYCGGVLIYVSSSNSLFDGELTNIVINLNAIVSNNFSKQMIKKITLESVNYAQYILSKYNDSQNTEINKEN